MQSHSTKVRAYIRFITGITYWIAFKAICTIWSLWLLSLPTLSSGQNTPTPPAFYQIAEHSYGIPDGLPDVCVRHVLLDSRGRLHLAACENFYASAALRMYEFDGTRAYPSLFRLEFDPEYIWYNEAPVQDQFYGFYTYRNEKDSLQGAAFRFNAITGITQCFNIEEQLSVRNVAAADGTLFVCAYEKSTRTVKVLSISDEAISSLHRFNAAPQQPNQEIRLPLAVTENDIWVAHSAGHIYRINRKDGTQRQYALPGVDNPVRYVRQIFTSPGSGLWINCDGIFRWDAATDSFIQNPYKPPSWKHDAVKQCLLSGDLKGNILLWYLNKDSVSSATLVDSSQRAFDYTPVAWNKSLLGGGTNRAWMSNDYKQGMLFFRPVLRFVEFTSYNAIQNTTGFRQNRSIIQLARDTIYAGKYGTLYNDNGTWKPTGRFITWGGALADEDVKMDKKGNIWLPKDGTRKIGKTRLYRYQPAQHLLDSFDIEMGLSRFDFLGEHQIPFATPDGLYLLNIQTRKTHLLAGQGTMYLKGLNQVFVSADSIIWVGCDKGLLRVDPRTGQQQWVNLDNPTTVIRIHEDAKGRLWLGTLIKGVLIYDPSDGSIKTIDETKGLSNNTVATLLEDDDSVIWAGTYNGITLLSPEGMVLGKIFKQDGLAGDECNRWSAMKMADGRLVFGSVAGLSFIDPKLLKKRIQEGIPPQIYLTGLSNEVQGRSLMPIDLLSKFKQNEGITVPAANRNLKINFALSNYIAPERSTFAYKMEGHDKDWNYIGNQRQLSLNALPPGKYNILIKGADGWGRWSEPPIVIPVNVKEFFYKTWWAFCLYGLVILSVFYFVRSNQIRHLREEAEKKHLQEIDSVKTKLYTNITHEFRTPLTVISGMADMIEKPANAKELIKRNSEGLLGLVNQLLDLAKLESGHLKLELVQADVVPYVQYLLESFQSLAASKNIHLVFLKSADRLVMDFDEKRLAIIISNLLSNAIKFTRQNGNIVLEILEENNQLLLKVKDNGIGIPPDKLPHIFERFYQVDDSATRRGEGTGIGLTLTRELVELMGGKITVQSLAPEGEGTEFTVSLPIHQNAAKGVANLPAPLMMAPSFLDEMAAIQIAENPLPPHTDLPLLLLIEDNPDVAIYIKACLQGRYAIEWAENGAMGIEKALEIIPDIIISDVMMPEKDGFEVCQTLKNDERTSHVPIVLLTAKADVPSRLEGLGVGADAYLSKPFLKEELFIRLEKLVELRRRLQEKYAGKDFVSFATETPAPVMPSPDDAFLKRATTFILDHLDNAEFGNVELARKMNMSESSLNRKMKALTDKTLSLFIRSVRLQQGKILLLTTDMIISEIAYSAGFNDPAYFSRIFSQEFGAAPSKFRN